MTNKLQPSGDILDGGWLAGTGATDLSAELAGLTPTDASFIQSSELPTDDVMRVSLGDPGEVPRFPVQFHIRARRRGSAQLTARLKEGTTVIAQWVFSNLPEDFTTYTQSLTQAEFDAVTSWNDVYLELEADALAETVVLDRAGQTILVRNGETVVLRA